MVLDLPVEEVGEFGSEVGGAGVAIRQTGVELVVGEV